MATLNAGSEKPLGLFRFGCFRLQNAVSRKANCSLSNFFLVSQKYHIRELRINLFDLVFSRC